MSWWVPLIGPATKILGDVLKRVLPPEKVSEKERLLIESQFQLALEEELRKNQAQFYELVKSQYQAVRKGPFAIFAAIADMLRMLVRPVVTFSWVGVYLFVKLLVIQYVLADGFQLEDVNIIWNRYDFILTLVIVSFWFGERTVRYIIETWKTGVFKNFFKII